jgi:hypothetical protein
LIYAILAQLLKRVNESEMLNRLVANSAWKSFRLLRLNPPFGGFWDSAKVLLS